MDLRVKGISKKLQEKLRRAWDLKTPGKQKKLKSFDDVGTITLDESDKGPK